MNLTGKVSALLKDPLFGGPLFLVAGSVLNAVIGFVFWVVAARSYTAEEIGLVAAMTSAAGFMSMIGGFGLANGVLRFLPECAEKNRLINTTIVVSFAAAAVLSVFFVLGTSLWSKDLVFLRTDPLFFSTFILVGAGTAASYILPSAFVASRRPGLATAHMALCTLCRIPLALGLASFGLAGLWISWGLFIAISLGLFVVFFRKVDRSYSPVTAINLRMIRPIARYSLGSLGADVPYIAATSIIPLMVLSLLGAESTAYYYIAFRAGSIVLAVASNAGMSLLVEGAYDAAKLRTNLRRVARLSTLLLIPALAVVFFGGGRILQLFGDQYANEALTTMWLISISSVPHMITEFYVTIKRVQLKVFSFIAVPWTITAVTLGVAWLTLPRIGLAGSGAGWVAGYTLVSTFVGLTVLHGRFTRGKEAALSGGRTA